MARMLRLRNIKKSIKLEFCREVNGMKILLLCLNAFETMEFSPFIDV